MTSKKRVAIVGTNGLPANYGGIETLAQNLVNTLRDQYEFVVYCSKTPRAQRRLTFLGARLVYLPFGANGWQAPIYDIVSLFHAFATADVVLYIVPVAGYVLPLNRIFGKNLIVNFGGLNEWEREKLSPLEKKYMYISCSFAAHFATHNVADCIVLQKSIKEHFQEDATGIRYGGDHTSAPAHDSELEAQYPFVREPYFVSVSRAQVDNKLHVLIDAFKRMPDKKLVLVSNWSVSQYGRDLFAQNQGIANIVLLPAIYDIRRLDYIRSRAIGYIHSHSYCGTAPSLVEAICLGLPVISWDVQANRETTQGHALFFDSEESLREIISTITETDLTSIKDALRPLAADELTWAHVCRGYSSLFDCPHSAS